jgi:hypothetical protein
MIRYQAAGFSLALVCLAGCVDVNGGAVELRWEIRNPSGQKQTCTDAKLPTVQLCAIPLAGGTTLCRTWPCSDYQGTTDFNIPAGRYALAFQPSCANAGTPSAEWPAPITRDISNGNVAELNTLLIEKLPNIGSICSTP